VLTLSRLLSELMDLVEKGHVKPISPIMVFPFEDIVSAFRYLRAGTHIGKVVISSGTNTHIELPVRLSCSLIRENTNFVTRYVQLREHFSLDPMPLTSS
jgi:hypothetical protein